MLKVALVVLNIVLAVVYPLAVWWSLTHFSARITGLLVLSLLIPIVESAADTLVLDELTRVRRCAGADCSRVFHDATRNGARRWCDMSGCGNRAKAARHRARTASARHEPTNAVTD